MIGTLKKMIQVVAPTQGLIRLYTINLSMLRNKHLVVWKFYKSAHGSIQRYNKPKIADDKFIVATTTYKSPKNWVFFDRRTTHIFICINVVFVSKLSKRRERPNGRFAIIFNVFSSVVPTNWTFGVTNRSLKRIEIDFF